MRYAITLGVLMVLLISSRRALPQQPRTTGAMEGTVVRAETGEPVAGARVTLNLSSARIATAVPPGRGGAPASGTGRTATTPAPTVMSDGSLAVSQGMAITGPDGKFSFNNLKPDSYRLSATADRLIGLEYGQRTVNGQPRLLFINTGQTVKDIELRLPATGTVKGRVLDEDGQPATGALVQLLRPSDNGFGRDFQPIGSGNVDDRGDYRVTGLPPGRYYLAAGSMPGEQRVAGGRGPANSARFSLVFYPNVADRDQALAVEVVSGTEVAFDMRVRRQPRRYSVRGRVVNFTGLDIPPNVNIGLDYRGFGSIVSGSAPAGDSGRIFDPATGNFELQNVAPGDYTLTLMIPDSNRTPQRGITDAVILAARRAAEASLPVAKASIRVVDSDIEGVVLRLNTGFTTTGRVLVEGQPIGTVPNLNRMQLDFITPTTLARDTPVTTVPAPDGTFQVVGLREGGEYRAQFLTGNFPTDLYVKSIRFGGDDVLGRPFKVTGSGGGPFEVTLGHGLAQINGTVSDAQSKPVSGISVVLISSQRYRMDLTRTASTDLNGHFSLTNVTPGQYRLFSWEAIDRGSYDDQELLKKYEQQGTSVLVTESSNQQVDVKLIPAQ